MPKEKMGGIMYIKTQDTMKQIKASMKKIGRYKKKLYRNLGNIKYRN